MLFLTDGQPTLPYGPGRDADNVRAVLDAAERARKGGIRVHAFAIGPEALAGPIATVELAARTQGYFIPVREPGDLVGRGRGGALPGSARRGRAQRDHRRARASVPHRRGRLLQRAGGRQARQEPDRDRRARRRRNRDATRARRGSRPQRPAAGDPRRADGPRNSLLRGVPGRDAGCAAARASASRPSAIRQELRLEIEREREQARTRAAEQRKQLHLELGTD